MKIKFIKNKGFPKNFMGAFEETEKIIFINNKLSLIEKIQTIVHELCHYFIYRFKLDNTYDLLLDILTTYCHTKSKRKKIKYIKMYIEYYFK
jgi:Zn-dependent peptidase ImmA (M78 family)